MEKGFANVLDRGILIRVQGLIQRNAFAIEGSKRDLETGKVLIQVRVVDGENVYFALLSGPVEQPIHLMNIGALFQTTTNQH